ncbi:diadenylate cyclase [Peribacillus saganii]|uniref:Diadenylate cyclase n=1 Tax=Peribacillus saganii TaxID=2303992 RepID=A0A372LL26_9BACI|nr:sporulation-specific diadenylate cyclase CdaS [Peribacillus saganii]RFU66408.1 diadenylate cyclase [Peribacillus saganii]
MHISNYQELQEIFKQEVKPLLEGITKMSEGLTEHLRTDDCCMLTEFEKLSQSISTAQSLASSFYLKSYLSPYTKKGNSIAGAAGVLAGKRQGGLIVIEREDFLDPFLQNGVPVSAETTQQLLETIFFPGGPLHDGAVLIRGDIIVSAANVLPLSKQISEGRKIGTRHRAAMGITEHTDAVAIVVSEETGRISFASRGGLHAITM